MKRNVKSTDPRKPKLVAMFKSQVAGCTKVTLLTQVADDRYSAHCMERGTVNGRRGWKSLGEHEVTVVLEAPAYSRCSCGKARRMDLDWDKIEEHHKTTDAALRRRYGYHAPARQGGCVEREENRKESA
jgi:hypothetical protein